MTGSPLLFLDVDGPLIPFGADSYPLHRAGPEPAGPGENPLLARIDPAHGARLAPRLGLPALPVLPWPEPSGEDLRAERRGVHWKTPALVRWAAGRPFVWLDDELTGTDRGWVSEHHPGRALLQRVDPRVGLADADFLAVHQWPATGKP